MDFETRVLKPQQKMQCDKQSGNFMALQSQLLAWQVLSTTFQLNCVCQILS